MKKPRKLRRSGTGMRFARTIALRVCRITVQPGWLEDLQYEMAVAGLCDAVTNHDTGAIFNWLIDELSFQGISDAAAEGYLHRHGNIVWEDLVPSFEGAPECDKLHGFLDFAGCQYQKGIQTCSRPQLISRCPLPQHQLRNGRLNQTAYSLFLFMREIADADIVRWIDNQLISQPDLTDLAAARAALIDPFRGVYGISDKVIAMALSGLMMGAGAARPGWFAVGASFVVVDTLVHNFFHRTGILTRLEATHPYGSACYRPGGCADVLFSIASGIDARRFNPTFPEVFPRLVQRSIWRYCSEAGLNICNGNKIDDRQPCENADCGIYSRCHRLALHAKPK